MRYQTTKKFVKINFQNYLLVPKFESSKVQINCIRVARITNLISLEKRTELYCFLYKFLEVLVVNKACVTDGGATHRKGGRAKYISHSTVWANGKIVARIEMFF